MALSTEEVKHFYKAVYAGNFLKLKVSTVLFLKQNLVGVFFWFLVFVFGFGFFLANI